MSNADPSIRTHAEVAEDFDAYFDDNNGCHECGGRAWVVRCIDDMCHGQDECIHGDPPSPCFACNRDGSKEDGYL